MAWWWLLAATAAVFLHPTLLGNAITLILSSVLASRGIIVSVKGASLLTLTLSGVSVELKLSSQTVSIKIDHIGVSIQLGKALTSWFEERPLKFKISKPYVTVLTISSTSTETNGTNTAKHPPAPPTPGSDPKSMLSPVFGSPKVFNKLVLVSRLLSMEVVGAKFVEVCKEKRTTSTVAFESMHFSALFLPSGVKSKSSEAGESAVMGSFAVLFKMHGFKSEAQEFGDGCLSFSLTSMQIDCEVNVAVQSITALSILLGTINTCCSALVMKRINEKQSGKTNTSNAGEVSISQEKEDGDVKEKVLVLNDIPKQLLIKVEAFSCQVIDDVTECTKQDKNGIQFGFDGFECSVGSSCISDKMCSLGISFSLSTIFADLVHKNNLRLLEAFQAKVTAQLLLSSNGSVQSNPVDASCQKVSVIISGSAVTTVTYLQSAVLSPPPTHVPPKLSNTFLPSFWPNSVCVGVDQARFELRDVHETKAKVPVGAVQIYHSSLLGVATAFKTELTSDTPLRNSYKLKVGIPSLTCRALLLSQHEKAQKVDMQGSDAKAVKGEAVSSGNDVKGTCHIDVRMSMQNMITHGVMDGKMRERIDEMVCGEVVVSEGRTEVARIPSVQVISTSPEMVDMRVSPLVEVGTGAEFVWSAAFAYRALVVALTADACLLRVLRAFFPPKPGKVKPLPQPMVFKLCAARVKAYGNSQYQLLVKLQDAELSLVPRVSDKEGVKISSMLMSCAEMSIQALVDNILTETPLMTAIGMDVSRNLEVVTRINTSVAHSEESVGAHPLENASNVTEDWLISFSSLGFGVPPKVQVGDLMEVFLAQDSAVVGMTLAAKHGVDLLTKQQPLSDPAVSGSSYFTSSGVPMHSVKVPQRVAAIRSMAITLQQFQVEVHSEESKLFSLCADNLCVYSEVLRAPDELALELRRLDHHASDVSYNNVMGSRITVGATDVKFRVHVSDGKEPIVFLAVQNTNLTLSPVIMASLGPIKNRLVPHHITLHQLSGGDSVKVDDWSSSKNPSWMSMPPTDGAWDVVVVKDGMPSKLYLDLTAEYTNVVANIEPQVQPILLQTSDEFKRMTPSPVQTNGGVEPLVWWDSLRYQLHGPCRSTVTDFTISIQVEAPPPKTFDGSILPLSSPRVSRGRSGSMATPMHLPGAVIVQPTIRVHFHSLMLVTAAAQKDAFVSYRETPIEAELYSIEQFKGFKVANLKDMRAFSFQDMTVSVPSTPPHRWHDPTVTRDLHHMMFLLPKCNATIQLDWKTLGGQPYNHHVQLPSPAVRRISSVSSVASKGDDVYHLFRSRGVSFSVDLSVLGPSSTKDVSTTSMELESEVGCWGACPLELLAWLIGSKTPKEEVSEEKGTEFNNQDPANQLLIMKVNIHHSSAFVSAWPSATDRKGVTLELKHAKLEQCKSRDSSLLPLSCELVQHELVGVKMHLSQVIDIEALHIPINSNGTSRNSQLLAALVAQRHNVRAVHADGGRQLALQAAVISVKQTPLDSDDALEEGRQSVEMGRTSLGSSPMKPFGFDANGYSNEFSFFNFKQNHACAKPLNMSIPESFRRSTSEMTRRRRSSVSSIGSRRSSITGGGLEGGGRRGSMSLRRESFDVFASSLLSPTSPSSPSFTSPKSCSSSRASPKESVFDDSDDDVEVSKFDDEGEGGLDHDSGNDSLGTDDEHDFNQDLDEEEEEEDDLLRTDLVVTDMRLVYTVAIRDRFTHMSRIVTKLFGDDESAPQVMESDPEDFVAQEESKSHGDRLTDLFLRRNSENLDDSCSRRSSNTSVSWKDSDLAEPEDTTDAAAEAAEATKMNATANAVAAAAATFESTIRYRVKFVNPQVNILCAKSEGALVLGVAEASLVGRDLGVFYAQRMAGGGRKVMEKHERLVAIAGAIAFSARMDVDVNKGVCWIKNVANPSQQDVLLRQVMTPFDMRIRAEEYSEVSGRSWSVACAAMTKAVRRLDPRSGEGATFEPPLCELRSLSDRLRVDLPELHLSLDRDDNSTLGDVVRNVLLAPPFESKSTSEADSSKDDPSKEYHIVRGHLGQWNGGSKGSRYALKAVVEEELALLSQERAIHPPRRVRVVEFNLGKGTWFLKPTQNDTTEVQIGFSGFLATHQFFSNETIESMITLENMWVLNDKPGPLSLKLPDPMVILKPRRQTEPICRYCFKYYTPEENRRSSCGCHANIWGEDGYYLNRSGRTGEWSCCGATSLRAPPCSTKQHASGAHMINVRAITTKPMLVGDTPVHVFSELQISLFPSTKQTLELQLTSDVASFISSYFFEDTSVPSNSVGEEPKSLFGSRVSGTREITRDSSDEEEEPVKTVSKGSGQSAPMVYLKYCRIGEVALELSTVGFGKKWGVNLDWEKVSLNSEAFHRSQRIVTWSQLGTKYCKHVGTNLVTGSRKKVTVKASLSTSLSSGSIGSGGGEEDGSEEVDVSTSSKSRLTSLSSGKSVMQKGMLGAASSMMKAKAAASSALKKTTATSSQKEARDMLFGNKR